MKEKSNPLWLTERYLKDYRGQKRYIALLESEIQDRYETATAMIAMYGEHIGHSSVEKLHPGAALAIDAEFQKMNNDLRIAKKMVENIEIRLDDLGDVERKIIYRRYFEPRPASWVSISIEVNYSTSYCRYLYRKALRYFAVSLFGMKAVLNSEEIKV